MQLSCLGRYTCQAVPLSLHRVHPRRHDLFSAQLVLHVFVLAGRTNRAVTPLEGMEGMEGTLDTLLPQVAASR